MQAATYHGEHGCKFCARCETRPVVVCAGVCYGDDHLPLAAAHLLLHNPGISSSIEHAFREQSLLRTSTMIQAESKFSSAQNKRSLIASGKTDTAPIVPCHCSIATRKLSCFDDGQAVMVLEVLKSNRFRFHTCQAFSALYGFPEMRIQRSCASSLVSLWRRCFSWGARLVSLAPQ